MAQVPYQPVPEAQPSSQGVRLGEPAAIPDAFGINISKAVGNLGSELMQRAVQFQEDNNNAQADAADVEFMKKAGAEHAKFSAMEGKERSDYFETHVNNLEKIRTDIGQSLTNTDARLKYDRQSRRTLGATIFSGARESAVGERQFQKATDEAWLGAAIQDYSNNPSEAQLQAIGERAKQTTLKYGNTDPNNIIATQAAFNAQSSAIAGRISTLAKDGEGLKDAEALKEKNWDRLTERDKLKVTNAIQSTDRSSGAAEISNTIYEAGRDKLTGEQGLSLRELEDKTRKAAKERFGNDQIAINHAVNNVGTLYFKDKQATRQFQLDNSTIVSQGILAGVKNEEELKKNPRMADAMKNLSETERLGLPAKIRRYNEARDYQDAQEAYWNLKALSNNDVNKFVTTDLTDPKYKLSQRQIGELENLRAQRVANPKEDIRVTSAQALMRGAHAAELRDLGIFERTKNPDNSDAFDAYTGMLQQAIEIWHQATGKPPSPKDITDVIGPQIIQKHIEPGFFGMTFGGNEVPFFKPTKNEAYDKFEEDQIQAAKTEGRPEPSKALMYRAYQRMQYLKYYVKSKGDEGG